MLDKKCLEDNEGMLLTSHRLGDEKLDEFVRDSVLSFQGDKLWATFTVKMTKLTASYTGNKLAHKTKLLEDQLKLSE